MSIHPSLKGADTLVGDRSVLTRVERIEKLKKSGKFKDGDSVFGLPKVRTKFKVVSRKKHKEAEAGAGASGEAAGDAAGETAES